MRPHNLVIPIIVVVLTLLSLDARAEETIVFLRHGEKPSAGLGQLTCQGFNRSLDLPLVLTAKFGRPNVLYAPNPAVKISDSTGSFYYVRPLATIEPTAIKLGMPVNTKYGYNAIASLQTALISTGYRDSTIFVVWEHLELVKLVQNIMNAYGGGVTVPAWASTDYDSLYVVRVNYGTTINAQFSHEKEGLNGQPTTCPY